MPARKEPDPAPFANDGSAPPQPSRAELQELVHELETHRQELDAQQKHLLEAQEALELVRDRFEELFDFAPIGYVALDFGGVIRQANLSAAVMLGIDRTRLSGRPLFLHVVEADRGQVLNHIARCRRGESRVETEVTLKRADNRGTVPVQLASAAMRRRDDTVFLTALIDLSERKRIEEERARIRDEQTRLRHEEQLARAASEAKDRFLAMLSHELRTPLTPIVMALEAIQQRGPVPAPMQATLDMIHRNVALETRLIDDLLDASRIAQGKMRFAPETIDLHEIVNEVMEMLEGEIAKAKVVTTVRLVAEHHHVHIDPVRLRQVVWNIVNNALRNTPEGGEVRVTTAHDDGFERIVFGVRDTGKGIEPQLMARIFNLFEQGEEMQRRGIGLGLGLPISKAIVEAHSGTITLHSDGTGQGTLVRIELPTLAAVPKRPEPAPPVHRQPKTRRVLLVEDNEDSAAALAEVLRLHGYEVLLAGSVNEALDLADQADVLISDIGLPDGTGHDLMRQIRTRRPLPAIALSGYGSSDDVRRSSEAGFARHIVKPVEPQQLLDALQSLTG